MEKLSEAFQRLEEDRVYEIVEEEIAAGKDPILIMEECNEGLKCVGDLFGEGSYYLTDLMYSVEIMEGAMAKISPLISKDKTENKGKVVIGTVSGDVHDVGKNIVISLLKSYGYDVIDAGIDVPAEKFIELLKQNPDVKVLGLSALLNTTYPEMKNVVDAVKIAGLRDRVKVIIGGTICTKQIKELTGADDFATQALKGVEFCNAVYRA